MGSVKKGSGPPIRLVLLQLVISVVAPLLLLVTGYAFWNVQLHRQAIDRSLGETARALSLSLDREVDAARAALSALALSPHLQQGDLAAFHKQSATTAEPFGGWIILIDRKLQQVVNTQRPFGESLPATGAPDLTRGIFATGRPIVSDLFVGRFVQRPVVAVSFPVFRDGVVIYDLRMSFFPERFESFLAQQNLPAGWRSMLVSGSGRLIASSKNAAEDRQMIWPWLMEGAAKRTSDILEGPAENGAQLVVAFQRSDVTNWLAVVAVPVAVAEGPTRQAALLLAAGVLASLILAVAAALVIGRRITGPLQSIAGEADGLIRGEPVLEKANSFSEIVEVRRALIKAAGLYRQGFETRLALEQEQRARAFAEQRREEAQKSERKIRRLIDANLIGVVIADDEQIFEANDAFFRIIGHSRAELEAGGLRWRALAPPEFQWLGDQALQELHERGEIAPFEQQYRRADGKEISVLLGAARIETDSSKLTWVCFVVDLTSQKQAQADLRQSEERYRALVMAISSVVWTTDPDGALRDPGHWCALTGQTPEQSAGWGWLNAIHPDDRQAARQVLASAIRERALINQSFRLRNRNGRYRWYSARGVPVFNADHTVREWVGVCFDIDEQKSAETGQQLLMAELDHRVRNILTTVQSMVSLTAPNVIAKEEYADLLRGRIAAMARTHSLLSWRAWNGATVVEILQDELAPFARNTGVISMEGDPELELRPKDVLDFAMVVHELTANAVRYGALSLPEGQVSVSWSVEGNDGGAMLRFVWRECNGPPVKARMYRGFGSRLIERVFNRGAARRALFDFDPDGLTCTLTMPLRPAYVPRTHHLIRSDGEKAPRYGSSAPRGRILVVQDETLVAMQLHRLLTQAGFEVSGPTERLSEALALSEDDTLTGAVIDMMPDPQGRLDLAVRLRGRGLPLLFVTDGVADSVPERFRGLPTVEKPIDPQAFLVAAGKAFHRFSSEEAATPEDRPAEAPAPVAFRN